MGQGIHLTGWTKNMHHLTYHKAQITPNKILQPCMIVAEENIERATGRVNDPLEYSVCTKLPRYYAERFHMYNKFPNSMKPEIPERKKWSI